MLQQLDAIKGSSNNDDVYEITEKRASLISILDTILNASIPLVGISVLEVLNSLFTHLIKSVHGREYCDEAPDASDVTATYVYAVHQGLAHSIGGLASQTYYQNQLNDIVGYIIAKLRAGTALERVEDLPIQQYRRVALVCLDLIVSTSKESAAEDEYNNAGNEISLSSWLPAIGLLTDRIPGMVYKGFRMFDTLSLFFCIRYSSWFRCHTHSLSRTRHQWRRFDTRVSGPFLYLLQWYAYMWTFFLSW